MAKKILGGVAAVLAVFLIYVGVKSPDYEISRQVTIDAAPATIFPYLNNAQKMGEWSPWAELDPKAAMKYEGPAEGVGAKTSWENGEKLGTGSATVTESVPNQSVTTRLEYVKPFAMTQEAVMSITAQGPQSLVTWSVRGQNNFIGRAMCVFGDMDRMVGGIFEKGLASLKAKAEAATQTATH